MKYIKKILVLFLIISCLSLVINQHPLNATDDNSIEFNLNSSLDKSQFIAYKTDNAESEYGNKANIDDLFNLTEDGISTVGTHSSGSTNNIKYIGIKNYRFENFEMILKGRFIDDSSWGWMGIAFRQKYLGSGFFNNGGFAGLMKESKALIWGSNEQGSGPFEGELLLPDTPKFELKTLVLTVVNDQIQLKIYNEANGLVSETSSSSNSIESKEGFISIASVDNQHLFTYLKITNLDENGNAKKLEKFEESIDSLSIKNKITSMKVGQSYELDYDVTPANANLKYVRLSSSNNKVLIASGTSLTAIGEGTVTVKLESILDNTITDSMTIKVTTGKENDGSIYYDFESLDDLKNFRLNYVYDVSSSNAGDYTNPNLYWSYNKNIDAIERINDLSDDPANDVASILIDKQIKNYELSFVFKNTTRSKGWIGVYGGQFISTKRFMDSGYGIFIQSEGYPTIWGENTGGIIENKDYSLEMNVWHVMKVKVFSKTAEVYIDDLSTPVLTKTFTSNALKEGRAGVFSSGSGYAIKSMTLTYLDNNGNKIDYYPVNKFDVCEINSSYKVGDVKEINVSFNQEATNKKVDYISSNSNICIAKNGKLVFINEGEVVITILANDNSEYKKEVTINVLSSENQNINEATFEEKTASSFSVMEYINIFLIIAVAGFTIFLVISLYKKREVK